MAKTLWKMASAAWLVVVVTSLAPAIEMYDEMPPGDLGFMYPEHNYLDSGPLSPGDNYEVALTRNPFLYKMLTSPRNQAVPNMLAGPKWIPSGSGLVPSETFDLMKDSMMKRGAPKQPAQQWKSKKGKVGSHMICYFKLCAFRPTN